MVEVELMDAKGAEIEDVWPTFPLVMIRRQGLGPQRLGPVLIYYAVYGYGLRVIFRDSIIRPPVTLMRK